jgi:hypothetical protein
MGLAQEFSLASATNLFKIKYDKLSENVYNSANVLMARMKKRFDFTGRQMFVPVPVSFQGGVGSGSLPVPNTANYEDALITANKVYSVVQVEREAIKASMNSEGAFVQATKEVAQKGVESWMRNGSRILFGDGTGELGVIDSVAGAGPAYTLTITAASWKEANWEERDYVNIETGNTDCFEITAVRPALFEVDVTRQTGAQVPVATDQVFMQNSENNDPLGLKGVLDATGGTLYSISVARRWQATQVAAGGAGLTTDQMNQIMLEVQRKSGKIPNIIVTSFTQYRKLLNLLEDQKQIIVEPRAQDLRGKVSFKALEFMSSAGAVPVIPERFCEDDRMYFLNDNFITAIHRPDFGWFDDDGTVFLRTTGDSYDARYGGYYENYIVPSFHGVLTGLAT